MDQQKPVKIVISGKLSYQDDISLNQAAQIIAFIDSSSNMELIVPATATRLAPVQLASSMAKSASTPREALDGSGAKTNPEKLVAFAGLVLDEGKDTFTLEDVKPLFRRAREATPKNITRDLDGAVRSGWVADADEKGEYYLTKKALEALETGFNNHRPVRPVASTSKKSKSATPSKTRRTSTEMPDAFKDHDVVPNSIDGYPNYTTLGNHKDRLIWALVVAKSMGIESLSNQEAVWLTDRLGVGISTNNLGAAFTGAKKAGYVNRSLQTHKIRLVSPQAENYLAGLGV